MPSSSPKVFSTAKTLVIVVVVAAFAILIDSNGSSVVAAAAASGPNAKCDQECGDHVSPICGSDGITYLNACHFDRAYCSNKELIPMGYGPCER